MKKNNLTKSILVLMILFHQATLAQIISLPDIITAYTSNTLGFCPEYYNRIENSKNEFKIFPNPIDQNDNLKISIPNGFNQQFKIRILNILGKELHLESYFNQSLFEINTNSINDKGMLFIEVFDESLNRVYTDKLIVK